ncbi:fimbrial protein [Scandinavium sp. V105_16]|uniref:Fimbrial protein n=1 Tax=Scandinavium lactucae TaxID=3095028 RepID=A0AAJ2VWM0_9ENTR|nr:MULTISPECIES: fimbrial protein [unclassified Scandinavium]MDX6019563.1 fimbrial protein [Scandinavium sp. V105_16]MDX6030998.1 fimbrial protein [Scandinavium sp. V105_12]
MTMIETMNGAGCRMVVPGKGIAALLIACAVGLPSVACADPDKWNVEGEHGELHVYGEFVEGACRLDMASQNQEVTLGTIPPQLLSKVGSRGEGVAFVMRLRDCVHIGGNMLDQRTGNHLWDRYQPMVSVTFIAPADVDTPELVKVEGITGMGLRMTDSAGRDIRLGQRGAPQFAAPGNDALIYRVQPERTAQALTSGEWRATVGFELNYD